MVKSDEGAIEQAKTNLSAAQWPRHHRDRHLFPASPRGISDRSARDLEAHRERDRARRLHYRQSVPRQTKEVSHMSDAFDQWVEWRYKLPGDRRSIPAELYAAVSSLPEADRSDRQRVNEAVRSHDTARREGRTAWLYLDDYENGESRTMGDPEWVKVFASGGAADAWLQDNDPEGVAWEYEVEGGPVEASVWLCLPDPASRAIGEPDWIKLFASKERARKNGLRTTSQSATFGSTRFRSDGHAFVDSSVWFAAAAKRDAQNERAKSILQSIDQYLTTDLVLVETCQLLKARFGRGVAGSLLGAAARQRSSDRTHRLRRSGCGFGDRGALPGREVFLRRPDEFCPDGAHGDHASSDLQPGLRSVPTPPRSQAALPDP
ncbi:type II toxin-antitoxin system VapC family toxin [Bradyrhizobium sp. 197]|nr:hypothetical protein [Bradyrhizobium sp. 197]MCK1480600.1 type II toxin-antitoxin system VapC family toxin [Bradyrhizobium sp. 197]